MNHSLSIITGPDDQKGTAILTVLFILVLLSTLAVYTTEDENIAIRRLQNQRDVEQSRQVVLAGEQWVIKALERDLLNAPLGVDYLGDEWALLQTDVVAIEDGQMQVQAIDESGKFNLNNLLMGKKWMIVDPTSASGTEIEAPTPWYGLFVRLLENTGIDVIYADAVLDWIDADDETTDPEGAEDGTYASADPPYLTANQPFVSVSELANVLGFGQAEMDALAPYVSALPVGDVSDPIFTKININTAPDRILQSLDENIDQGLISNVLQSRNVTPFGSAGALYNALSLSIDNKEFEHIVGVSSQYFTAQSCAKFGRVSYAQQSLVRRDEGAQEAYVISRQRRYNCGIQK